MLFGAGLGQNCLGLTRLRPVPACNRNQQNVVGGCVGTKLAGIDAPAASADLVK